MAETISRIVIPARLASTRLPQKLLLNETGKTLLQHTYEAAQSATLPNGITVAVDHVDLQQVVVGFGGQAMMTDPNLPSGTDRVVEVAKQQTEVDVFVNVQGDEPEIEGQAIDLALQLLAGCPSAQVATLAAPIRTLELLEDPACVKVVCDAEGKALYFSRSPIPFVRSWQPELLEREPPLFLQHIGLYAYRREFLLRLAELPNSPLEQAEKLEQLRFLQAGCDILVGIVPASAGGIDTEADYRAFVGRELAKRS